MPVDSLPNLVDLVRRLQLLPPTQLTELTDSLQARFPEPRALAGELVRRGWLTPYQINQIFLDRGAGLVLGSYIVLERLGEGGMGAVFTAHHQKLGRVVALKLIRKERLTHPDAVRRFYREVQAAAALEHPHIVRAYDAGEAGGAHFFVMEHVEGTDLARLVKQHGPLSIERSCDYARQAALGLQHAFERGMVHRDIKPANLLLATKGDVIKVLDMGLARLERLETDAGVSTTLTQEGAVMGTPDYIAPEQARDSHTVDIRADLYSLGCTLYVLLTGRVPFPGGSLTEKLLKHTLDEPQPVEQLRPETPLAVAAVVRKLMAKRPNDRYQTPAEAAEALASAPIAPAAEDAPTQAEGVAVGLSPAPRRDGDTLETGVTADVLRRAAERRRRQAAQGWRRLALYMVGGLLSLGLGVWLLTVVLRLAMPPAPPPTVAQPPTPPVARPPTFEERVAALPADEQVKAVADELKKLNPGFDGTVTPTIENGVVVGLEFLTEEVADLSPVHALAGLRTLKCPGTDAKRRLSNLSPLKGMKLTDLNCSKTSVSDLAPLKDMKLTSLESSYTLVSDLSPLKDMKLTDLACGATPVSDLSPLQDMKLTMLACSFTPVSDLSPLKDMKLTALFCDHTKLANLSLLKNMPLRNLNCDFNPWRDKEHLRSIPTLTRINGKPAADFWKEVDAQRAEFDAWCKQVAAMKPEDQAKAVGDELKKRNSGFDGKVTPAYENGVVVGVEFLTDEVTNIAPVRALAGLRTLKCIGSNPGKGRLTDVSPLKGMKLAVLYCWDTQVSDLSPLKDMKLTDLRCEWTQVSDLSPLEDMKLTILRCPGTRVSDLSPLKDMKLTDMNCSATRVSDLSPLKGWPLKQLVCDFDPKRDAEILRSIPTLQTINDKPAAEFWKDVDAQRAEFDAWCKRLAAMKPDEQVKAVGDELKKRNPGFDGKITPTYENGMAVGLEILTDEVTDIAPVRALVELRKLDCSGSWAKGRLSDLAPLIGLKLTWLRCYGTQVSDLSPLKDMELTFLHCAGTKVSNLSPLLKMKLTDLDCGSTLVTDLSPLKDTDLTFLDCRDTPVSNLSPLKDMKLTVLSCEKTRVTDLSALKKMPLKELHCDFDPKRDAEILRSIKTLETINGKPAAAFWNEFEESAPPKP